MPDRIRTRVDGNALVEKRRIQIISNAVGLFGRRGYPATTVRNIGQRAKAGVSRIYR